MAAFQQLQAYCRLMRGVALAVMLAACQSALAIPPECNISASPPATAAAPIVPGTQVTLMANCTNSPTSYAWSPGGGSGQSITVTPSTSTIYSLTACNNTASNFCSAVTNTTVYVSNVSCTISASPAASAASPVAPGTVVTLTAVCTNNPSTFAWSPGGATTSSIVVMPTVSSTYSLTACVSPVNCAPVVSFVVNVTGSRPPTAQVFPMVVSGSVTPTVANITAAIQFRPQDRGSTGSVYVFALVPASRVANVSAEKPENAKGPVVRGAVTATGDTPLPCVLAQLTASGQLTSATASTLQAYITGVLSSQGASVNVLNGISTALISGSVFYVGYGANSTAMINGGVHQSAVTIPGTPSCTPQAPQTGWWWNAAEDGRGFGIEVSGNNLFMSGYLYDDTGHATWVVSPGPVALDGSFFNGTLYQVANGQTLTGAYKPPGTPTSAGAITLTFTDARHGTLIWPGGAIPIVRFDDIIGSGGGTTPSFVPENGWWWNADESGRGYFLEIKNNYAFIAGYMYETDGRPVWYLTQNPMSTPQSFSGSWLQVQGGQTLTGPYKKPTVLNANVGSVGIVFQDASNATLTLPNGRQVAITRQRF